MTADVLHVNWIIPSFDTHRKEQKKNIFKPAYYFRGTVDDKKIGKKLQRSKRLNGAIAEFICMDQIPISVVDKTGFRNLVEQLDKRHEMPRRKYFQPALRCLYNRPLDESNSGLVYGCYNSLH